MYEEDDGKDISSKQIYIHGTAKDIHAGLHARHFAGWRQNKQLPAMPESCNMVRILRLPGMVYDITTDDVQHVLCMTGTQKW